LEDVEFEYICQGRYNISLEATFRIDDIVKRELEMSNMIFSQKYLAGEKFGKSMKLFVRDSK
tara:strand:- start:108 stop:293 length:186 start_codon:yes stop_codon:yes gene_type:complete